MKISDAVRGILIAVAVIFVLWIAGSAIGVFWLAYGMRHARDHLTVAQLADETHLEFPRSARTLNTTGEGLLHTILWAKIEIDGQDTDAFLKAVNKRHPINISHTKKLVNDMAPSPEARKKGRFEWWDVDSVTQFVSAESAVLPGSGGTMIAIVIDTHDTEKAIVYLSYFND